MRLVPAAIAVVLLGFNSAIAASDIESLEKACPYPKKGLNSGQKDVRSDANTLTNENKQYQMDIYYAFSSRSARAGSDYCMRYDAENTNKGSLIIEELYWPLAND